MVYEETFKAVSYIIKNCDTENYKIIIVDNASKNDSFKLLSEKYAGNDRIVLIQNEENLGFSGGNNVGFAYAKKHFSFKYIVMMNNDIYLLEKQLFRKLENEFNEKAFSVAGPLVIQKGGDISRNPYTGRLYTSEEIEFKIKRKSYDLFFSKIHLYGFLQIARKIKSKMLRIFGKKDKMEGLFLNMAVEDGEDLPAFLCKNENVALYGCCLIFSQNYLKNWDGLDARTFMYYEEEILYAHMIWSGERTVYLPDIVVFHNESATTKKLLNKDKIYCFDRDKKGFIALKELYREHELEEKKD